MSDNNDQNQEVPAAQHELIDSAKKLLSEIEAIKNDAVTTANKLNDAAAQSTALIQEITQNKVISETQSASAMQLGAEISTQLTVSQQDRVQIKSELDTAQQHLAEISASVPVSSQYRDEILAQLQQAKTDSAQLSQLAKVAEEKDKKIIEYQGQLSTLKNSFEEFNTELKKLLPGATGVGLAKSFNARKFSLRITMGVYGLLFVSVVVGFAWVGYVALNNHEIKSFTDFAIFALERSPMIAALILLEEFSRRQFSAAVKLEEDYAYKESISIAFDGFKKAMSELDASGKETLAHQLSMGVIGTLTDRPGRLIDANDVQSKTTEQALLATISAPKSPTIDANLLNDILTTSLANTKKTGITRAIIATSFLLAGIAIGYYFSSGHVNITTSLNAPAKTDQAPATDKAVTDSPTH